MAKADLLFLSNKAMETRGIRDMRKCISLSTVVSLALALRSYNDNNPGLRLFVIHPDGTFETEIGSEKQPFPTSDDGTPYRPAPQSLPRAAAGTR